MPDNYRPSQGNPFYNPLMSTPDWGAGIRDTLNQMWSYRKYQEELDENKRRWEVESAQKQKQLENEAKANESLSKYHANLGLAALGRVNNQFKMHPVALQALGKELNLPKEVLDNVLNMTPEAQEDYFKQTMDSLRQLRLEQKKQEGPLADAATERARLAGLALEDRKLRESLKRQGQLVSGVVTGLQRLKQQYQKPLDAVDKNTFLVTEEEKARARQPYESALNNIAQAEGEISALGFTLASGFEIPDEAQAKIKYYLNNLKKIPTGEVWQAEQPPQAPLQEGDLLGPGGWRPPAAQQPPPAQFQGMVAPTQTSPNAQSSLPPEVIEYMNSNPGEDLATVLKFYQAWKKKQGNR